MHHFTITALALRGFEHQHQIGGGEKASLIAFLSRQITERDRDMGFADPRGANDTTFSLRSTKARLASSVNCLRGAPVAKVKSY
jgi:hypothetical protein